MKVQLSQIEDFESAPSRMKIQWKERKNCRRQELVNDREWYHFSEFYDECNITHVKVENKDGSDAIGKEIGDYITIDLKRIKLSIYHK